MAINRLRGDSTPLINGHGKKYETIAAKTIGARLRPSSGAMVGAKGDMVTRGSLIETKTTTSETIPIKLEWLVKITGEALAAGKSPVVLLAFVLPTGRPRPVCSPEWVCIPKEVWQELQEAKNGS